MNSKLLVAVIGCAGSTLGVAGAWAGLADMIGGAVKSGVQDAVIQHTYEKTFNTTKEQLNGAPPPPQPTTRPATTAATPVAPPVGLPIAENANPMSLIPISEEVKQTIFNSDVYRNAPPPRPLKVNFASSKRTEYTGSKTTSLTPSTSSIDTRRELHPTNDKCFVIKEHITTLTPGSNQTTTDVDTYVCGIYFQVGSYVNGKLSSYINNVKVKGSIFPLQIGAEQSIQSDRISATDSKILYNASLTCRITSKTEAKDIDPRLTGMAWGTHCQNSNYTPSTGKTSRADVDGFYFEDLGLISRDLMLLDHATHRFVVPKPGEKTVLISADAEYGSRSTYTYSNYDLTLGEAKKAATVAITPESPGEKQQLAAANASSDEENNKAKNEYIVAAELYNQNKYAEALSHLLQAKTLLGQTNSRIQYLLVKTKYQLQQFDEAKKEVNIFFDITPNGQAATPEAKEMETLADQIDKELAELNKNIAQAPNPAPAAESKASETASPKAEAAASKNKSKASSEENELYNAGVTLFQDKKYLQAHAIFTSFINSFPKNDKIPHAILLSGDCYYQQKKYGLALLDYQKMYTTYPDHAETPTVLLKQGQTFEQLKDPDSAKTIYQKLIEEYPSSKQATTAKTTLKSLK